MGNCLEVSDTEIKRARAAKRRKMLAKGYKPHGVQPVIYQYTPAMFVPRHSLQGPVILNPLSEHPYFVAQSEGSGSGPPASLAGLFAGEKVIVNGNGMPGKKGVPPTPDQNDGSEHSTQSLTMYFTEEEEVELDFQKPSSAPGQKQEDNMTQSSNLRPHKDESGLKPNDQTDSIYAEIGPRHRKSNVTNDTWDVTAPPIPPRQDGLSSNEMEVGAVVENHASQGLTNTLGYNTKDADRSFLSDLRDQLTQQAPPHGDLDRVDVVVTYSVLGDYELDIVRRLTRLLEADGLSVWAERLGDSSIAQKPGATAKAIVGAKALIVMLSEGSCNQRFIRDHVALATLGDVTIFPVATEKKQKVVDALPRELKLPLDPYKWVELTPGSVESQMFQLRSLARCVKDVVEEWSDTRSAPSTRRGNIAPKVKTISPLSGKIETGTSFWDGHFGHRENVQWSRLQATIKDAYGHALDSDIPGSLHDPLLHALQHRLGEPDTGSDDPCVAIRTRFLAVFDSEHAGICKDAEDVWNVIRRVATTLQALKDVLTSDPGVKRLVMDHIDHFNRLSVTEALGDLVNTFDPNLRASSMVLLAMCLASQNTRPSPDRFEKALNDKSPLVREAGCLSLAHLRAISSAQTLHNVWESDESLKVREAARISLDNIGGQANNVTLLY